MFNPSLPEPVAEWIELTNLTDSELMLTNCVLNDEQGESELPNLRIPPLSSGRSLVVVGSNDPLINGGLVADATHALALRNSSGEPVQLFCNGTLFDAVTYLSSTPEGYSFQKSSDRIDVPNDTVTHWCQASQSRSYLDTPAHYGTPGTPNTECP